MASYTIPAADGVTRQRNTEKVTDLFHHFELRGNVPPAGGTVDIKARRPGADEDHVVSVGKYDFSSPTHIDHIGPVSEWIFDNDAIDNVDLIYITITSTPTGKGDGEGIDPADKAKLDAITNTGSGQIMTAAERSKLSGLSYTTDEDQLLEGLAFGQLYAKETKVG